jgi:NADH-quinone oxidoreductase subunit L
VLPVHPLDLLIAAWALPPLAGVLVWALGKRVPAFTLVATAAVASAIAAIALAWVYWGDELLFVSPARAQGLWLGLSQAPQLVFGINLDKTASLMLAVVALVYLVVVLYAAEYLKNEPALPRFWGLLGLFLGAMYGLVVADNLLFLFVCWELVGVCSYGLIGFWHRKPEVGEASTLAFLVNRAADAAFLVGILVLLFFFTTLDMEKLRLLMQASKLENGQWSTTLLMPGGQVLQHTLSEAWLTASGLLLFIGVIGKSALFPLSGWLPRAMVGPTPVSALLHAATMVAAGVYLIIRAWPLFTATTLQIMAWVGVVSAVLAGFAALYQTDLKRLLAFSTLSQLGWMVMGLGCMAYGASTLHLVTHAFFKMGLFLLAGLLIHAAHSPSVLQIGLHRPNRWVKWAFIAAAFGLMGVPLTGGYLSKEGILAGAFGWANGLSTNREAWWAWGVPVLATLGATLTAAYTARMLLLLFGNRNRESKSSQQLSPSQSGSDTHGFKPGMGVALAVFVTVSSLWVWYGWNPLAPDDTFVVQRLLPPQVAVPLADRADLNVFDLRAWSWEGALQLHTVATVAGWLALLAGAGWMFTRYHRGTLAVEPRPSGWQGWAAHNWHLESAYTRWVVQPVLRLAHLLDWFDRRVVDASAVAFGRLVLGRLQPIRSGAPRPPSLARMARYTDEHVVDALPQALADGTAGLGNALRNPRRGQLQGYLIRMLAALLGMAVVLWLLVL